MDGGWLLFILAPAFITFSLLGSYSFSRVKTKRRSERTQSSKRKVNTSSRRIHTTGKQREGQQRQQPSQRMNELRGTSSLRARRIKGIRRAAKVIQTQQKTESHSSKRKKRTGKFPKFRAPVRSDDDDKTEFEEVEVVKRPARCKTRIVLKWKKPSLTIKKSGSKIRSNCKEDSDMSESRGRGKKSGKSSRTADTSKSRSETSRTASDNERSRFETADRLSQPQSRTGQSPVFADMPRVGMEMSGAFDKSVHMSSTKTEHLNKSNNTGGSVRVLNAAESPHLAREMQRETSSSAERKQKLEKRPIKLRQIAKIRRKKFQESQMPASGSSGPVVSKSNSISSRHIDDHTDRSETLPSISSSSLSSSQESKIASSERSTDASEKVRSPRSSKSLTSSLASEKSVRTEEEGATISESRTTKRSQEARHGEQTATLHTEKAQSAKHERKAIGTCEATRTKTSTLADLKSLKGGMEVVGKDGRLTKGILQNHRYEKMQNSEKGQIDKKSLQENKQISPNVASQTVDQLPTQNDLRENETNERTVEGRTQDDDMQQRSPEQENEVGIAEKITESKEHSTEGSDERAENSDQSIERKEKDDEPSAETMPVKGHSDSMKENKLEKNEERGEQELLRISPIEGNKAEAKDEKANEKKESVEQTEQGEVVQEGGGQVGNRSFDSSASKDIPLLNSSLTTTASAASEDRSASGKHTTPVNFEEDKPEAGGSVTELTAAAQQNAEEQKHSENERSTQLVEEEIQQEDELQEEDGEEQHTKEITESEESLRLIAGQLLDIINKNNLFANTVTHDQDVLLKAFFAGEAKFDEDVESAIFIALNTAIERLITIGVDEEHKKFLARRSAAINIIFASMQSNVQQFVPPCWRSDETKSAPATREGSAESNSSLSSTNANEKQN